MADNPARRFNANVRYTVRREGNRFVVINLDRNRRMNKTHATMREARAHIAQTKRRVSQVIGYHNQAPARAQRNNRRAPPPPNRNPVGNVGRVANRRRGNARGAARGGNNRGNARGGNNRGNARGGNNRGNADGARAAPATPPRRANNNNLQRRNTVRRTRRRATPAQTRTRARNNGPVASRTRAGRKRRDN